MEIFNKKIKPVALQPLPLIYEWSGFFLFFFISAMYISLSYLADNYIFTNLFYYRSFSNEVTIQSIDNFLKIKAKFWWLNFLLQPLITLVKVSFATVCISIGIMLSNVEFKFQKIFKTVLIAELVFVLYQILFLVHITFSLDSLTMESIPNYYLLTFLSFYGVENVVEWLVYPLQTLNMFQVIFMLVIGWLLSQRLGKKFLEMLAVVVPSYMTGLIVWLVLITFLTLQT